MIENRLTQGGRRIGPAPTVDTDRADRERLVDIAYATVDSPIGTVLAAATGRGLVRLVLNPSRTEDVLKELSTRISPRVLEIPARLDDVRRELDEYFSGRRRSFDAPIDWSLSAGFTRKVLRALTDIPYGKLASYSEVARRAGSPRAARAAGNACHANPLPIVVPCHRVVHAGGGLGGYGSGVEVKEALLKLEGAWPAR